MKFLQDLLRWAVVGAVFALPIVPMIVTNGLFFPYITGKNFAFRIFVEIMAAAWLALALSIPQYRPRRSWILGAFALFVLIIGIADILGAYPFKSIWSNFERMEGWVTLAHLLAYLVVVASVLQTEKLWRRLFYCSLGVSLFLALYGFMQMAGLLSLGQAGAAGWLARVDATLGNPIYLGVYMLFHAFLAALLWMQEGTERWRWSDGWLLLVGPMIGSVFIIYQMFVHLWRPGMPLSAVGIPQIILLDILFLVLVGIFCTGARRYLWAFILVADAVCLLFTGTRGATLGLIGGALFALLLFAMSKDASRRLRIATAATICGLVLFSAVLKLAQDTPIVQNIMFLNRLASISLTEATTKARLLNMGMAWEGVKERPLLGWGQENYALVFDKYYDPRMYAQEQWFDRVHSSVFDWLVAGGILGLLGYLAVFGTAVYTLWRSEAFTALERSILIGLLGGHFVQNLTVFDNITSWILFMTVLAYIVYRAAPTASPLLEREFIPKRALTFVAPVCAVLGVFAMWAINGGAYAANTALIEGMKGQREGITRNLEYFKESISYNSLGTQEAREQLAQATLQVLASNQISTDVKQQFVQLTVEELDKQATASPMDARFPLFAAGTLDAAGLHKEAAPYYQKAHELSPGKQSILYQRGRNALLRGDANAAIEHFALAYNLEKSNRAAGMYLVQVYYLAGNPAGAIATLEEMAAMNPNDKAQYDQIITEIRNGTFKAQ